MSKTIEVFIEGWNCPCGQENYFAPTNDDACAKCDRRYNEDTDEDLSFDCLDVAFPTVWEICGDCQGEGSTYLGWPASDQPAFTAEDFAYEGPDFYEDYMGGAYDKPCPVCKGSGKIKVINYKMCDNDKRLKKLLEAHLDDVECVAQMEREMAAERRMGA